MSRGKLCKDWAGFQSLRITPLIPKISRNTLVGGEQEGFYFLLPCHVANVAEGKKEFVVLGKFDETTNYANLAVYN